MGLFDDAINGKLGQHIPVYIPYHQLADRKEPSTKKLARLLRTRFNQETLDLSVLPTTEVACSFWLVELGKLQDRGQRVPIIHVAGKAEAKYKAELEELVTNLFKRSDAKSLIPKNAKGCKFFLELLQSLY